MGARSGERGVSVGWVGFRGPGLSGSGGEWPAGPDGLAQLGLWSVGPEPGGLLSFLFLALFSVFFSLYIFFSILFF